MLRLPLPACFRHARSRGDAASRAHAERALAFDPECADARCVLAQVAMPHDRHWQQSLHHYLQGIQRSPRHAPLHHAFAFAVVCQGDFDLAERAFQTAISLDPLDLQVRIQRWLVPHYRGDYDAAIGGWEELLAATPEHLLAITLVGAAHLAAGRPEMAISRYQIACDRQTAAASDRPRRSGSVVRHARRCRGRATSQLNQLNDKGSPQLCFTLPVRDDSMPPWGPGDSTYLVAPQRGRT